MNNNYEKFRAKVFSAMRGLANDCPEFSDAEMLVAASDVTATLKRSTVHKNIDVEWVDKIEETLPYLDLIVRNPTIMIEDVDEILPVELSRNIAEKTIKHLAQHTNMILTITEKDEVIPQKLLNVYHEETLLTYENKFINTLLARLSAFVDKRYKFLRGGYGTERNYQFRYSTEFEHYADETSGRNLAKIQLAIDLASPMSEELSEAEMEANERYLLTLARIKKISNALMSYMSSPYVRALGRNYIRPPVIRTNAILKNKNMRVCLNLWEYIESFDKAGYSFVNDEFTEMPSDNYISDLYSSIALQYTDFYNGVAENPEENRLLAKRRLSEVPPDFDSDFDVEDLDDYRVYDSEYKKLVPVSRLMNNRKKLSDDERRIRMAIMVSLKADEMIHAAELAREAEERRLAREKRLAEEEAARRAEEEAKRAAEEEARRIAEEEARRAAEEEARRIAEEEARRAAEEEARRIAEEEARRAAEEEARRIAEEEARRAAEEEARRRAEEEARRAAEEEARRIAEEEARRRAEEEARRIAEEEAKRAAEEEATKQAMEDNTFVILVDNIINDNGEDQYTIVGSGSSARIVRVKSDSKQNFAYSDFEEGSGEGAVRIPYTREQYLALPRKKKKSVLMNVKKMISYQNTMSVLELLKSRVDILDNPRIQERIKILEEKAAEESKSLPKAELWKESVQRLKR